MYDLISFYVLVLGNMNDYGINERNNTVELGYNVMKGTEYFMSL
jgi:hypothetical protein